MYHCQFCKTKIKEPFLDLGNQPLCNKFIKNKSEFLREKKYPLAVMFCPNCKLVQLTCRLPTRIAFDKDFNYLTGANKDGKTYFNKLATKLYKKYKLTNGNFIVDIGSNDGTFLSDFKSLGITTVLGVDPARKPAKIANSKGIKTINKSFEESVDEIIKITNGKIHIITAFNVLAHTYDLNKFMRGIYKIMRHNKNATFISQSHYLPNLIRKFEYDTIYHEHSRYYSVTSLKNIFQKYNLYINTVFPVNFYGGSILVYSSLYKNPSRSVLKFISSEEKYSNLQIYQKFGLQVEVKRKKLISLLNKLKKQNMKIVGIGAPMKSTTLLNYCNIGTNILDYITEVNEFKIGTYSPGMHIKIVNDNNLQNNPPDAALILSWNISKTVISKLKKKGYTGKFIVPIPTPIIISAAL